jgi:hypothetical protein
MRLFPRPGGGIGRRVGLKHLFLQGSAGSTPALGTTNWLDLRPAFFDRAQSIDWGRLREEFIVEKT